MSEPSIQCLVAPHATGGGEVQLSIVVPVYGCAACLEALAGRIFAALPGFRATLEIVLVDDGSKDNAWEKIQCLSRSYQQVVGLGLSRNFGQHAAIFAGLSIARGEWIVVMDCDLQDLPEEIPRLLAKTNSGLDAIVAEREERRDSWSKQLSSRVFHLILGWLTGQQQNWRVGNFGVYSRRLIDQIVAMDESHRCFPLMVRWTGLPMCSVPIKHAPRPTGKTSYDLASLIGLATSIAISHSDRPLRLVISLGLLLAAASFGIVALSIWRFMIGDIQVAGFTSIMASIWFIGGCSILCLGVVGTYVGAIFTESKKRPPYVIARTVGRPDEREADHAR